MTIEQPLWLASRSPRRRQMLEQLNIDLRIRQPDIDDAKLMPGRVTPQQWVAALAYLKSRRVADALRAQGQIQGTVLGADTVCVTPQGEILGQPRNLEDARRMLKLLSAAQHQTMTGVCLIDLGTGNRILFHDAARVIVGALSEQQLESYLASGGWRGKAGAYNLSERVEAGWPIQCIGDPATVMGLPIARLKPILRRLLSRTGP